MRANISLADARGWFVQRLAQHCNDFEFHRAHRRNVPLLLETDFDLSFEPEIRRELQILDDIKNCQFRPGLDETETLVHSWYLPDVADSIRFDADQNRYEGVWNVTVHHGSPCMNLLALLLAKG
jgi:hypothetical protein